MRPGEAMGRAEWRPEDLEEDEMVRLPACHGCAGAFPTEALDARGFCTFCAAELKQPAADEHRPTA